MDKLLNMLAEKIKLDIYSHQGYLLSRCLSAIVLDFEEQLPLSPEKRKDFVEKYGTEIVELFAEVGVTI